MTDPSPETVHAEIEVDYNFKDGRLAIELKFGEAKIDISYAVEEPQAVDTLVSSIPSAVEAVLNALIEETQEVTGD